MAIKLCGPITNEELNLVGRIIEYQFNGTGTHYQVTIPESPNGFYRLIPNSQRTVHAETCLAAALAAALTAAVGFDVDPVWTNGNGSHWRVGWTRSSLGQDIRLNYSASATDFNRIWFTGTPASDAAIYIPSNLVAEADLHFHDGCVARVWSEEDGRGVFYRRRPVYQTSSTKLVNGGGTIRRSISRYEWEFLFSAVRGAHIFDSDSRIQALCDELGEPALVAGDRNFPFEALWTVLHYEEGVLVIVSDDEQYSARAFSEEFLNDLQTAASPLGNNGESNPIYDLKFQLTENPA